MATLPPAPWTRRQDLADLTRALGADNLRWVGGAVRDTLVGAEVADVDGATPLSPARVVEVCKAGGIRTVPTGIAHGTVTAILPDGPVEITTLRRDVSTDGRHATVAFTNDWREDAARRDFTINALYAHPETLRIEDWFGGLDDLAARRVRFIGEAEERIREDHLRILRYFRFHARFGSTPDAEAVAACTALASMLKGISRERVASELLAILALPDPAATLDLMATTGVLAVVLPEAKAPERRAFHTLLAAERAQGAAPSALRRMAALLPPVPSLAEAVSARLRLSKAQRARLVCAAARTPADVDRARALAYEHSLECARDRVLLTGGTIDSIDGWSVPQLPLKGGQIVARGVAAGPEVARILQAVERRWIEEEFPDESRVAILLEEELVRS